MDNDTVTLKCNMKLLLVFADLEGIISKLTYIMMNKDDEDIKKIYNAIQSLLIKFDYIRERYREEHLRRIESLDI